VRGAAAFVNAGAGDKLSIRRLTPAIDPLQMVSHVIMKVGSSAKPVSGDLMKR
jgi:hypothetical protein